MILLILADLDNAIAKDGKQITFIPEDLARFKARTTGEVILMGRKTFEDTGTLPRRITGVMTRKNLADEESLFYFSSEEELDEKLKAYGDRKIFLVGGAGIIQALFHRIEEAYITRVNYRSGGDVKIPSLENDFELIEATPITDNATEEHWIRKK
ncbi:dihydrofolate reductase [Peptoniphilus sp. EMRHCC_23]|uniref:dihydrofolate reductase n=1 Tax=Peptoniphilus rachelemmaiella TaxID=2811779 RepID=UPI001C008224|nr:dihydrofolate reductase [Peptoniphilus rachelemmaiella]